MSKTNFVNFGQKIHFNGTKEATKGVWEKFLEVMVSFAFRPYYSLGKRSVTR
jgi:hypothetical protein